MPQDSSAVRPTNGLYLLPYWPYWHNIPEDLFLHLLNHFIVYALKLNYRFYPLEGPFWIFRYRETHVTNSRINTQHILLCRCFDLNAVHHVTASIVWQYR